MKTLFNLISILFYSLFIKGQNFGDVIGSNAREGNTAIASITGEQIYSVWDLGKPQVAAEMFRRYDYEGVGALNYFRMMGKEEPVGQDTWYAYENSRIIENIVVRDFVAAGAPGESVDITLHPSRVDDLNNFYARQGFIVTDPVTEDQGYIYSIDSITDPLAPVITLKPIDVNGVLGPYNEGQEIGITNGAWAAGTGLPKAATKGAIRRQFYAQIFKEKISAEGTQLANENWTPVWDTGESLLGWYNPCTLDMEYRLAVIEDGAIISGQENTNSITETTIEGSTNRVTTTKGILTWGRELGNVMPITAGSFDIADLDELASYYRSQTIESRILFWMQGAELYKDVENAAVDFIKDNSGGTDFTYAASALLENGVQKGLMRDGTDIGNVKDFALSIGFSNFKKNQFHYVCNILGGFSNPKTFGSTGYTYNQKGILMPISSIRDAKSGAKTGNIVSKYRSYGGANRKYQLGQLSGIGAAIKGVPVNEIDSTLVGLVGHHGIQAMKCNQITIQEAA